MNDRRVGEVFAGQTWEMVDGSWDDARARAWVAAHPGTRTGIAKMQRLVVRLDPEALPAMVGVLATGTPEEAATAHLVLVLAGAQQTFDQENGSTEGVVVLPDSTRHTFRRPPDPTPPTNRPGDPKPLTPRTLLRYLLAAFVAVGLSVSAYETSGAPSVILACLAGIIAALTLYPLLFIGVTVLGVRVLLRRIRR